MYKDSKNSVSVRDDEISELGYNRHVLGSWNIYAYIGS